MKSIQPIQWKYNAPQATDLNVRIIFDNLSNTCNLYWQLFAADSTQVDSGNLSITGDDYQNWDGNNDYPYTYVANKWGITIIGDDYGKALGEENLS